jgi:hypothetical protein
VSEKQTRITLDEPAGQPQTSDLPDIGVVRQTVEKNFPDLWPAVDAGISVCANTPSQSR